MSDHIAPQIHHMVVGETRNVAVQFTGKLDAGELLTGTPIILERESPNVLTISNKVVNVSELTILGQPVPAGEAVQCTVTGVVAGTLHHIDIKIATDSTPVQTLKATIRIKGVAP